MRITVVGAGAVGGILAGHLARAGRDLVLVDPWYRHLETIARDGLLVETLEESFRARPATLHFDRLSELRTADVLILAVKAYDTAWIARLMNEHLAHDGLVISAQNGMNEPTIVEQFGLARTVGCVVSMGGQCFKPGAVRRTTAADAGALALGALPGAPPQAIVELGRLLAPVGSVVITDAIEAELWGKLILNVMSNPVGGLTGRSTGDMWTTPAISDCILAMAHEAATVATATGVTVAPVLQRLPHQLLLRADRKDRDEWHTATRVLAEIGAARSGRKDHLPSLLQDVLKQRRTEIDALNGWIREAGRRLAIPTPANQECVALVHDLELSGEPSDERLVPLQVTVRRHYATD